MKKAKEKVTLEDLHDLSLHIVRNMATKEDLARVEASIRADMTTKEDLARVETSIRADMVTKAEFDAAISSLKSEPFRTNERLSAVEEGFEKQSGLTTEIDHLDERVTRIETHVGLRPA